MASSGLRAPPSQRQRMVRDGSCTSGGSAPPDKKPTSAVALAETALEKPKIMWWLEILQLSKPFNREVAFVGNQSHGFQQSDGSCLSVLLFVAPWVTGLSCWWKRS